MKIRICLFVVVLGWISSGRAQRPVFCSSPSIYHAATSGEEVIVLEEAEYLPELAARQTRQMRQQLACELASEVHYPAAMRRQGASGKVMVAFTLNWQGQVADWEIADSSSPLFERAVVSALRRGITPKLEASLYRGAQRIVVPVQFRLP